jgi:predicted nucleic acid-binding protein
MSNNYIILPNGDTVQENELYHYGVLGMKWGVRRGNSAQAYARASKKLKRLDRKADKAVEKAYEKKAKADKKASSFFAGEKATRKADFKAQKAQRKAVVQANKARKWLREMDKTFANTTESLSREQIELGRKYTAIMDSRTF